MAKVLHLQDYPLLFFRMIWQHSVMIDAKASPMFTMTPCFPTGTGIGHDYIFNLTDLLSVNEVLPLPVPIFRVRREYSIIIDAKAPLMFIWTPYSPPGTGKRHDCILYLCTVHSFIGKI